MYKKNPVRAIEFDFSKGILISLMVIFHLGYFHEKYSSVTDCVYAFHMPAFLLLSGYLFNPNKEKKNFLKSIKPILSSYIIFELIYLISIGLVGKVIKSSNEIELSISNVVEKIAIAPIGTYWYLHILLICYLIYFIIKQIKLNEISRFVISGIVLYGLSVIIVGLSWNNIIFFLLGVFLKVGQINMIDKFTSIFSLFGFILIIIMSEDYTRGDITSIGLTLLIISFLCAVTKYIPKGITQITSYLGRNTFPIVLFSPFFTIPTKFYIKYFEFDNSAILWMLVSFIFIIFCSLCFAKLMDKLHISTFLLGKELYSSLE